MIAPPTAARGPAAPATPPVGRLRAPRLPTWTLFAAGASGLGACNGLATTIWLAAGTPIDVAVAFGAAMLGPLLACAAFPVLRALGAVAPTATDGGRGAWRWIAFYAVFLGLLALGAALRGWVVGAWFHWPTQGLEHGVRYAGPAPLAWLLLAWAELEAHTRAAAADEALRIRRKIDRIFDTREALALARARRVDQVGASLVGRVEPRLASAEQAIAALQARAAAGAPVPSVMLGAVRSELEAVAEGEFRALSHVLHPSIVKMGLVPAISSLVARFEGDLPVTLAFEAPELALSDQQVLAAYRIAEAALDNARQHARAQAVRVLVHAPGADRLRLEIADDGVGFDPATAARGIGFAAIDGRVALAGGCWGVAAAVGAGTLLWAELALV